MCCVDNACFREHETRFSETLSGRRTGSNDDRQSQFRLDVHQLYPTVDVDECLLDPLHVFVDIAGHELRVEAHVRSGEYPASPGEHRPEVVEIDNAVIGLDGRA